MNKMPKCESCRQLKPLCLCDQIIKIGNQIHLTLVIHAKEALRTSNTGQLAALSLEKASIKTVGDKDHPLEWESLLDDQFENWFLFPSDTSVVLTPEMLNKSQKPVNLLVPDGNWTQALRMFKKFTHKVRQPYQLVTIPVDAPSQYKLRTAIDKEYSLSTLEAIAKAYGLVESVEIEHHLMKIFHVMVERNLFARGFMKATEVKSGVGDWIEYGKAKSKK